MRVRSGRPALWGSLGPNNGVNSVKWGQLIEVSDRLTIDAVNNEEDTRCLAKPFPTVPLELD